jgi:hypothetical protein
MATRRIPIYIRIADNAERHIGDITIDTGRFKADGPAALAWFLREAADRLECEDADLIKETPIA